MVRFRIGEDVIVRSLAVKGSVVQTATLKDYVLANDTPSAQVEIVKAEKLYPNLDDYQKVLVSSRNGNEWYYNFELDKIKGR